MSVVVKGAFTATVLAVGSASTYFLVTGKGNVPITLAADTDNKNTESSEYNNKIGADFKHLLVSPFNPKNKSFWEKAYERLNQATDDSNRSEEFKKTTKVAKAFTEDKTGTDDNKDKALNRVCYELYKGKAKSELDLTDTNKKKLTTDIFTYCSVLGGLPKTVKEVTSGQTPQPYQEGKLGKAKEEKLVATTGNDTWWDLKTKEFFAGQDPTADKFFSPFYQGKKSSLRTKCEEAYKLQSNTSSSATQPTETEVLKYCSLLGS